MHDNEKNTTFAPELISNDAQMAESVDALVSNTSGATHPGSTPGLGTKRGTKVPLFFCFPHADMSQWQCGAPVVIVHTWLITPFGRWLIAPLSLVNRRKAAG